MPSIFGIIGYARKSKALPRRQSFLLGRRTTTTTTTIKRELYQQQQQQQRYRLKNRTIRNKQQDNAMTLHFVVVDNEPSFVRMLVFAVVILVGFIINCWPLSKNDCTKQEVISRIEL